MSNSRIYLVSDDDTGKKRLIRASHPSQAVGHAARDRFHASVASQDDLVHLVATGVSVEDIKESSASDS